MKKKTSSPRRTLIPTYRTLSEFRRFVIIQCRMRGRSIEFVYDEASNKGPVIRDQKTLRRLGWRLTKGERADLNAFITEPPAVVNARLRRG